VPAAPPELLTTNTLSLGGRLRLLAEPFVRPRHEDTGETVHDFARRRLGREAADVLVDTAVAGISAGDSRDLDVAAAFPQLVELEREHGSLFRALTSRRARAPRLVSFAQGMGSLTGALAARIGHGVQVQSPVDRITRGRRVEARARHRPRDRSGPGPAGHLRPPRGHDVRRARSGPARELAAFPAAGLSVVALAFRASDFRRPLDGYGYLVTPRRRPGDAGRGLESSLFAAARPQVTC